MPEPVPQLAPTAIQGEVKLAVVLGSGGSRGMAHVGVLEEFEQAGLSIDLIVGCSAGSIIGAMYADDPDAARLKESVYSLSHRDMIDYTVLGMRYGLVLGKRLRSTLASKIKARSFEELSIPLVITATDLLTGDLLTIGGGELLPAIHASSAVPLYFHPVEAYGRVLVDGAVANPLPVEVALRYKPKTIVAVDLSALLPSELPRHLFGVAMRSLEIAFYHQSRVMVEGADVIIRPEMGEVDMFDDSAKKMTYEAGRRAAREAIPLIEAHLALQRHAHSPMVISSK